MDRMLQGATQRRSASIVGKVCYIIISSEQSVYQRLGLLMSKINCGRSDDDCAV